MSSDLHELARTLSLRGQPYVVATVVWRRSPSSGKVGSRAVITPNGHVTGWLGGACAEPAVISEAKRALEDGSPRLMFLGPPEELANNQRDGVVAVPIACQSDGALEVYVEPVFPKPHVVVIGRSPAVDALAGMAAALGWRAAVVDDGGSAADHQGIEQVFTSLDLAAAGVDDGSFVVVATQGHYDEDALQRALETPARYVGLVASRKRAKAVIGYLRDRGVPNDQVSRVHAPAGLDLGHVAPDEIAVAILAELVKLKAAGDLGPRVEPIPTSELHEAIDPVCGMTVEVATARNIATHEGRTYYFCSAGCRQRFEEDPAAFVTD